MLKDLTGITTKYGIYVKKLDNRKFKGSGKARYWICECSICKQEFSQRTSRLIGNEAVHSCAKCSREKREDLTGQIFNDLLVEEMIYPGPYKRTRCKCLCLRCGNHIELQANHLKSGEIKSCGCLKSHGEETIARLLRENNIKYEQQKTFPDLKYKNILRCDFYLPDFNLIIEYNGEQHYKPVKLFGGEENLKIYQERDKIKKEYCLSHNINFLIIKYDEDILTSLINNNIIKR